MGSLIRDNRQINKLYIPYKNVKCDIKPIYYIIYAMIIYIWWFLNKFISIKIGRLGLEISSLSYCLPEYILYFNLRLDPSGGFFVKSKTNFFTKMLYFTCFTLSYVYTSHFYRLTIGNTYNKINTTRHTLTDFIQKCIGKYIYLLKIYYSSKKVIIVIIVIIINIFINNYKSNFS